LRVRCTFAYNPDSTSAENMEQRPTKTDSKK
jgi:hypothetical protein